MKNGLIPQKRITALQNLAKLISHMNNQSRIEYRTIAIEKIPLNENHLKSKGFPHSNILKKSLESICYHICEEITGLPFNHISDSMRPGIYLGPDIAGTKNKSKITDWHINKENIYPHIHGLIILPFEIRKWQEKILIQKIKDKLQLLPFVENKSTLIKSNRKINLSPYKENTPLWNFTDYASKLDLKNASSNHTNSFIPVIYPYGLDVHKIRTRHSYKKNRDGYDRKLNDIYRQAATTYEKLLLEPWHFFNSDILRDISDKHRDIIIEHKFSGESLMNSSRKNRIIYELEKDGGAYIKEQQPNHYPSQVQKLFIKPDVKEFIDELATAAVLDKAEPEPDDSLVHLVASKNPFSGYRSFTDWAKSYGTYEARHLLAQMRHLGTTGNCAA